VKIAYLHRISFEESESRFLEEASSLGIELVLIKYKQLRLVDDHIFYKDVDLADFDLLYFRAVGIELEWAKLLEIYAHKHGVPVVDQYLLDSGPLRRFKSVMGVSLINAGVNYAKTAMIESFDELKKELSDWKLPVVVKLSQGGRHGMGTFWIRKLEDMEELKEKLKDDARGFLVQPYIPNDGDYRVMTVGYKCVGGFKRKPKEEKMVMNKSVGRSEGLDQVPGDVMEQAEKASKALGVEFSGIDLVRDDRDGKVYIIEVNEAPQFKVFEKRTGVNVVKMLLEYLMSKIKGS
jgi:glutathione synthase/RimK-type ligase-like ATP-grasp enzyme